MKTMLENLIFNNRRLVVAIFIILTIFMMYEASHLKIDAGFAKLLPLKHEYIKTYVEYRDQFGGANRVVIAIRAREGDIFTPKFFEVLAELTDDVFFIEGVDRTRVMSLFTPNVRFTEVVEDGISGGNVIPDDFEPTPEGPAKVRENILKSNYMGRLVANDFSSALLLAELLEVNPTTGEKLDYIDVAGLLEGVRDKYSNHDIGVEFDYHIIGFAKVIGDIADGAGGVIVFFILAFFITALLVFWYSKSVVLTLVPLFCSLTSLVWQFGVLHLMGLGLDPLAILVPFQGFYRCF